MAIQHLATIICNFIDPGKDGFASLIQRYNNLFILEVPGFKAPFYAFVEVRGNNEPFNIVIEGPSISMTLGEGMAGPPEDGEISEFLQYSTTAVVHIPELALPEPGIYAIAVYSNGVFIHRREFGVIHKPQAFTPEQLTQPQWESST